MFAVPKPTSEEERVWVLSAGRGAAVEPDTGRASAGPNPPGDQGAHCELQRLIVNLIPSNACHRRLEGDVGALPSAGQWDSLALMGLELFLGTERDSF